MLGII